MQGAHDAENRQRDAEDEKAAVDTQAKAAAVNAKEWLCGAQRERA